MYSFLVLGLIPGTNIQISFWAWLVLMALLAVAFKRYKHYAAERIEAWWHQFDDIDSAKQRKPLHANHLHLRGL